MMGCYHLYDLGNMIAPPSPNFHVKIKSGKILCACINSQVVSGKQHSLHLAADKPITRMAGSGTLFRLFLILLVLSHLICLKAIPVTRTENLMQGNAPHLTPENSHKVIIAERNWHSEEPTITERMDLELHDYSPSGPNGRHTPRAP
ncbi:hypothetical protein VNO77_24541 [Canavalia gladiata]|uniref:Uncharacterized protein n=1 Tax=Canavalia gladiata TaxID=3824 RepID=A0AAN9QA17_CANGL